MNFQKKQLLISEIIKTNQLPQAINPPPQQLPAHTGTAIDPDLAKLAFSFGQYLNSLPGAKAYASEACKVVYQQIPDAQDILKRCG